VTPLLVELISSLQKSYRLPEEDLEMLCYYLWLGIKLHLVDRINPLNAGLNPICYLLALLGARHILHVSRIRVNEAGIICGQRLAFCRCER